MFKFSHNLRNGGTACELEILPSAGLEPCAFGHRELSPSNGVGLVV